jgi:hypothetical protein
MAQVQTQFMQNAAMSRPHLCSPDFDHATQGNSLPEDL